MLQPAQREQQLPLLLRPREFLANSADLVGLNAALIVQVGRYHQIKAPCVVIHGEADDTVPLDSVMNWARPQGLPVLVVPGGGHFFHGQLTPLKNWVVRHLSA